MTSRTVAVFTVPGSVLVLAAVLAVAVQRPGVGAWLAVPGAVAASAAMATALLCWFADTRASAGERPPISGERALAAVVGSALLGIAVYAALRAVVPTTVLLAGLEGGSIIASGRSVKICRSASARSGPVATGVLAGLLAPFLVVGGIVLLIARVSRAVLNRVRSLRSEDAVQAVRLRLPRRRRR
ncbi:hypothetical protein [Actinomadura gamaensis]|uniref:Integral membrane protein n=1 Tax=Actinomadura gamaensis TaxID=1763541 RepID=A0ABV9TUN7_9ACTN